MLRSVLWDMDGVLISSEPLHVEKLIVVASRHGVTIKEEDFTRPHSFRVPDGGGALQETTMTLGGAGDKNIYHWAVSRKAGLENTLSKQQWLDELLEYYVAHKDKLHPREHMIELVQSRGRDRTIQGIVTSGIPAQLETNLSILDEAAEKMGFGNHQAFRRQMLFALDADQVKVSKPNPESYLMGIGRVKKELAARNIDQANAVYVAVEDSVPGVAAALAAGAYCVQLAAPNQRPVGVGPEL